MKISEACVKGGINGIEVTFTIDDAEAVIKELALHYAKNPEVIIGAGTVKRCFNY